MARVFVDVSVHGKDWFRSVLEMLLRDGNVRFTYATTRKLLGEHENARKVAELYRLVSSMNRIEEADTAECDRHIAILESVSEWQREHDCDYPHIFALVYVKPTRFVFSSDQRMANCRRCMNAVIDSRYCDFIVIAKRETYDRHRDAIHKP